MPVFGTQASRFNDDGVTALYQGLVPRRARVACAEAGHLPHWTAALTGQNVIVPPARSRWRNGRHRARLPSPRGAQSRLARERQQLRAAHACCRALATKVPRSRRWPRTRRSLGAGAQAAGDVAAHAGRPTRRRVRGEDPRQGNPHRPDQHHAVGHQDPQGGAAALRGPWRDPEVADAGERAWQLPYTAGVFAFKREGEDPDRMFAGEGDAFRTNRRFKLVSEGMDAKRLSTAFDSVTLYGEDPHERPDIYGKVGNSGVSIATLDDMKVLYDGFDLCSPSTSVSMTINGPAPTILAMFMNTAIDQQIDKFRADNGASRPPTRKPRSARGCCRTCAARCRLTS
jgi:methylmalonyl-CoA mutase